MGQADFPLYSFNAAFLSYISQLLGKRCKLFMAELSSEFCFLLVNQTGTFASN